MRKYQLFIIGIVISVCIGAVCYLIYTIEKIESESVSSDGIKGIILYTTNENTALATEDILKNMEKELSEHINTRTLGTLKSSNDVEEVIKKDSKESINYSIIEFNRSNLIKEKNTVTIKVPGKDAINHKVSLMKAENIRDKAEGLKVNIIESSNTPKMLNTYICIEVSDVETPEHSRKLLDKLILLDE